MKKVNIISSNDPQKFVDAIAEFIRDKDVWAIEFTSVPSSGVRVNADGDIVPVVIDRALIIYEE